MGLRAARAGEYFLSVFEPLDLWVGDPVRFAVERQRLVLRHRHRERLLRDVWRTELAWKKRERRKETFRTSLIMNKISSSVGKNDN